MSADPDSDLGRFLTLMKGLLFVVVVFGAFGFIFIKMDDHQQVVDAENKRHWEGRVAAAIAEKKVLIGMTEAEAIAAWGTPWKHATTSDGGTEVKVFDYSDRLLYLKNGYVIRWAVAGQ